LAFGLIKTFSQDLGPEASRVNSILPGYTYTDRIEELLAARMTKTDETKEAAIASITSSISLGRMGMPEEFAHMAVFLCSPAASFINGVMLQVDGGLCQSMY
jgi:3-oxoacyl-[acyl-carrier protein] reductase